MRRELTTEVGPNGVLTIALAPEDANTTVRVVVETVEKTVDAATRQAEWNRFIARTAGKWQGDFVRDQGEYEERDPL